MKLVFNKANKKLVKLESKAKARVYSISLLSGWSCPGAKDCLSRAVEQPNGSLKIKDGKDTKFRCYSASQEALFTNVYKSRKKNLLVTKKLLDEGSYVNGFLAQLPSKCKILRWHVAGDFINQKHFDAAVEIAKARPDVKFYFYTKNIPVWLRRLKEVGKGFKPGSVSNLIPTASLGGKYDDLVKKHGLRHVKVVYSEKEAQNLNLPLDNDDSHASMYGESFALVIHGVQPKDSEAAVALQELKVLKR